MSDVIDEMRNVADQLRSQLATIRRDVDEWGRSVRIAVHHAETVASDFHHLDHSKRSISAALVTAFDEMEKLDVLIAAALLAAKWPAAAPLAPPPPGGNDDH